MTESAEPIAQSRQAEYRVTDPNAVVPVSCDIITDLRMVDGLLWLSMASRIQDDDGPAEARIVARLRIPLPVLSKIADALENVLGADRRTAN